MKILFVDQKHKDFYNNMMNKIEKSDSYIMSVIYLLSMQEETRLHFKDVFNINSREINIEGLDKPWQTGTSSKVTKLAFNLWNGYSKGKDCTVDNIFSCSYAPFFYEAVKLRYPAYANKNELECIGGKIEN